MIKSVFAAVALCSTFSAFAGTNLVTDGSFESAQLPAGDYGYYSADQLYGWTAVGSGSIEVRRNIDGDAQDGDYYAELDSTANSSMTTSIDTVAGQTYSLSFYFSNRPASTEYNGGFFASGVAPASTNGLSFSIDGGADVLAPAQAANTTSDNLWQLYTTTFVANSSSTTLRFNAEGTSDSIGTSLDNVSVTAVPEPATLAMMAAGLLGLVGLGRRRHRGL